VSASDRSSSATWAENVSDGYSPREATSSWTSEGMVSPALDEYLEDRIRRVWSESWGSADVRGSSVGGSIRALVELDGAGMMVLGPSV
jgi:hypothetical protein